MPLPMNTFERLFMLKLNAGPAPMMDVMGAFSFFAVSAAVRLDLFNTLDRGPADVQTLASLLAANPRGLAILLEVLVSLGYIRKKGGRYRNSRMASRWLASSSPRDISDAFRYYHDTMPALWPHIDESVKKGAPHINFYDWLGYHPAAARSYQRFMMKGVAMIAPELLRALKLPPRCRSIIDVGGGHGGYAVAAALKDPSLSVMIFESEYSRDVAESNIRDHGLGNRVRFVTGDYLNDPFPEKFDAVFLFNVLHQHGEDEIAALLKKTRDSLNKGGMLFILDSFREGRLPGLAGAFIRIYGLLHFHFLGGDNHPMGTMRRLLTEAGFGRIQKKMLIRSGMCLLRVHL